LEGTFGGEKRKIFENKDPSSGIKTAARRSKSKPLFFKADLSTALKFHLLGV
jgi:hypothetical protein